MNMQTLALAFLAAFAIGGVAWVFIYPYLSGEKNAEKRRASVARAEPIATRRAERAQRSRREQVEESLKEVESRHRKNEKVALATRIQQAGLSWSKQTFLIISAVIGLSVLSGAFFVGFAPLPALGLGFAAGFGLPRWMLGFLKKRREKKFLDGLPDAVDVIVRGIRAGLPLFDSIKMVAADAKEPIKSEFAAVIETQAIGMPLGEACGRLYERMPLPETNFFAIVIAIQTKSGGNLSEALGNLSKVLRDRKKMAAKVQAMSMEAKASATIIGALPLVVMGAVYATSPGYMEVLFVTPMGHMLLAVSTASYAMGIFVMKKMINFDF
ncbi:MAG: pilus assembly protein [Proteobacteria bacterium SG_bin9]|nr:MAG: pilus assembly protein [Proteobacteria bacterium SG_bin9]